MSKEKIIIAPRSAIDVVIGINRLSGSSFFFTKYLPAVTDIKTINNTRDIAVTVVIASILIYKNGSNLNPFNDAIIIDKVEM